MAAIRRGDRALFRRRIVGLVSILMGAWPALGASSVPTAQATPIADGRPAGVKCKTPGRWIPKLVSPANDADGNFVEDAIDALAPLDPVDVILACNRRPGAADRARFTASGGTLTYVGRTLSVAHLSGISAGDAVLLGADERVAFVFLDRELAPFLDTSLAAIRVTASSEYAGKNLEELVPDLDGEGVTVAVLDTGIDAEHEVFEFTNFVGGADFSQDPPVYADPDDENGHGTHVAAIIAAEGGASGNRGVAPRANLFDVRVTDASGSTTMSTVGQAIDVIVAQQDQLDIGVLFVGLGCDCDSAGDDPLSEAANRALQAGIVVVAPMGNGGIQRVPAPAAADGVIAVAAMDDMDTVLRTDDAVAALSNFGPRLDDGDAESADEEKPDCAAPGIGIVAAEFDTTDGYVALSGTSMAAAHVAGLAALIREARPEWTPLEVRDWILRSSEPIGLPDWEETAGHGEIDAYEALLSVRNLERSGQSFDVAGERMVFDVWESWQGNTDLDGDGDVSGPVLHVYDGESDAITNLATAGANGFGATTTEIAFFYVNEGFAGSTDLNGDGDVNDDFVIHAYDWEEHTLTNLGVEGSAGRVGGSVLAFEAREGPNGFTDLNGDGDATDNVVFVHDVETDVTLNLVTTETVRVSATMVAIQARESAQGNTDLNGDGDTLDKVMFVYDVVTGSLTNLGLAGTIDVFSVSGDVLVFEAHEAAQGSTDLNGDGDAADRVLHAYDRSNGTLANLGLATHDGLWRVAGRTITLEVSESDQGGTDLNGDGDAADYVIHVADLDTPGSLNLELASIGYEGEPETDGESVAFPVSEAFQAGTDLNGDGDTLDDVLHVHDLAAGTTSNLGIAVQGNGGSLSLVRAGRVAFLASESAQAAADLNGDGDATDLVLHTYDPLAGVVHNLGVASDTVSIHFVRVKESAQGATDLNGDGDASDVVLFANIVPFDTLVNTGLAFTPSSSRFADAPTTALRVRESTQGGVDLNGDGDTLDDVFFVVRKL